MKALMGFIGASIAGWIGWAVPKALGGGFMTAFIVSTVASGFGMYYGIKWAKNNMGL